MPTWTDFLADKGERVSRVKCTAAALSIALHVAVILPFIELPMPASVSNDTSIDVTFEFDSSPHGTPAPKPTLALLLPDPTAIEPPTSEEFLPPPPVTQPAPPDPPKLKDALAPVEAAPAVDGQEFAEAKPVAPSPPASAPPVEAIESKPPVKVQPKPQPPAVTRTLREAKREDAPGTAAHPASISPGQGAAQRQAEQDYFQQIVQKISRYRFYSRQQSTSGLVVTRLTLARDGGVLDVALLKSSGSPTLDTAVVDTIRRASPFPPLPPGLAGGGTQTFVVPINYTRDR